MDSNDDTRRLLDNGTVFNEKRYNTGEQLGRGATSSIVAATDQVLDREIAIKVLHPGVQRRPKLLDLFTQEARLTARLQHPNIVPVHDLGVDPDGRVCISMKRVRGETLSTVLAECDRQGDIAGLIRVATDAVLKVCDAIAYAHSQGIIHRDIKPNNIMVGDFGQVLVMDWGFAVHQDDPLATAIAGTPGYMAPEQAKKDAAVDARTDVYGIGGLLYFALTGLPPHPGETSTDAIQHAASGLVIHPARRAPSRVHPPALCGIIMRALDPDPDQRYQTVQDMREDVYRFLRGGGWFETRSVPAGTVILREGDPGDAAYIVVEGTCRVEAKGHKVTDLGPGETFGETAVLSEGPRTASVVALTDMVLRVVTRETLDRTLDDDPWLGSFVRALAERFRAQVEELATYRGEIPPRRR